MNELTNTCLTPRYPYLNQIIVVVVVSGDSTNNSNQEVYIGQSISVYSIASVKFISSNECVKAKRCDDKHTEHT
jgi:hypothetical protein